MRRALTFAAALIALVLPAAAVAASDSLLKLDPPKGELAKDGKGEQIEIQSFQWGTARSATGENVQGAQDIVITGSRIRQKNGNLSVSGKLPGCTVGKRYSGAQFASGSIRYELKDVVISNCAAEGLSLDYGKVTVRGWNPEPKQQ